MRTLTPALRAAQRSASAEPYLRVRLYDRDAGAVRLRWRRLYAGAEPDGPCALALAGDGALLRARIDPASGALSHQRAAAPGPGSAFADWTAAGTAAAGPRLGLAAAGTRALIASVRADGRTVETRESADSGASFAAPRAVAAAPSAVTAVAAAVQADGTAAVFFAAGGAVRAAHRRRTGRWRAPAAWTRSLASVNGLAARFGADWEVLVSGADAGGGAGVWSALCGAGGALPPGRWSALAAVASASPGTAASYRACGLMRAGAPRAVFVESYGGAGAYDRVHLAAGVAGSVHGDGLWRDPRPFARASAHGLGAAADASAAWLGAPDGVWRAAVADAARELTADVVAADIEQGARGRLRLTLRGGGGRYGAAAAPDALAPGGELAVEPGYRTSSGLESSEGPRYWIAAVRRRGGRGGAAVDVDALDGQGLLEAWTAPSQLVWPAGRLSAARLIAAVAQRAGLRLSAAGASAESAALRPAFTVRAGERGSAAVRRLLAMLPDRLRTQGRLLVLFEPAADDEAVYAYGPDHPPIAYAVETARPAAGRARVFGDGVFAEAADGDALAAGAGTAIAVDANLGAQPRAAARARALLRQSRLAAARGELVVRPNVAQEAGDVITLTDAASGLDAARFRVAALRLRYARGGPRPVWEQTLTLGEA